MCVRRASGDMLCVAPVDGHSVHGFGSSILQANRYRPFVATHNLGKRRSNFHFIFVLKFTLKKKNAEHATYEMLY